MDHMRISGTEPSSEREKGRDLIQYYDKSAN